MVGEFIADLSWRAHTGQARRKGQDQGQKARGAGVKNVLLPRSPRAQKGVRLMCLPTLETRERYWSFSISINQTWGQCGRARRPNQGEGARKGPKIAALVQVCRSAGQGCPVLDRRISLLRPGGARLQVRTRPHRTSSCTPPAIHRAHGDCMDCSLRLRFRLEKRGSEQQRH